MTDTEVLTILRDAFMVAFKIAGPILITALLIGVVISLIQTVTQIQENTLTFVPKMIVIFGALAAFGQFLGAMLLRFAETCFSQFPRYLF